MNWKQNQKQFWVWGLSLVVMLWSWGISQGVSADSSIPPTTSARELFQSAYENRYTWDSEFPGYTAEVGVQGGDQNLQGTIRIESNLTVSVTNLDDADLADLVKNNLQMEMIHRRKVAFDQLHGNHQYELDGTDEMGAVNIQEIANNRPESYYKVTDQKITQVNRVFNNTIAVKVDTLETENTPQGYLVSHFKTTFYDANTGDILAKQAIQDVHKKFGNYYILTRRVIRETTEAEPETKSTPDITLQFNNIELL